MADDPRRARTGRRRRRTLALAAVLTAGALACVLGACASGDEPPEPTSFGHDSQAAQSGRLRGSRVHLDENGRPFVPTPGAHPEGASAARERRREEAKPFEVERAPGGGDMVVLGGRLRHDASARVDDSGGVAVRCEREHDASTKRRDAQPGR